MQRKWVRSANYRNAIRRIVDARHKAGMSQKALAEALGKPPSWVAKVERFERRLDLLEFIAVARALGVREVALLASILEVLPRRFDI